MASVANRVTTQVLREYGQIYPRIVARCVLCEPYARMRTRYAGIVVVANRRPYHGFCTQRCMRLNAKCEV